MKRVAATIFLCFALTACPRPSQTPVQSSVQRGGVTHIVQKGETLWRIAKAYGVSVDDIAAANALADSNLEVGQQLFIPGAKTLVDTAAQSKPEERTPPDDGPRLAKSTKPARFDWPLVGVLYAKFGPRGEQKHDGLDIAAPEGTEIRAAGDGTVLFAGEQKGYGHIVIVQHADGLLTLYAHNRENLVKDGARVEKGQAIAKVGQSGKTSGPHLHFEVREGEAPMDPMKYLPEPP